MIRTLRRLFIDHPREVGETYIGHMAASSRYGFRLLSLGTAALLHSLVPGLFRTWVSREICVMAEEIRDRANGRRHARPRPSQPRETGH